MSSDENKNYIKKIIQDYIDIENKLSELNKQVKEIRNNKNNLATIIKQHMIDNGHAQYNLKTGSFKLSKTKSSKKLNKNIINDVLMDTIEEEEKINVILDTLFDDKDQEEIIKLEFKKSK